MCVEHAIYGDGMHLCRIYGCHENTFAGIFSLYPGGIFSPSQFESFSRLDQTCGDLCYAYRSRCRTCGAPKPTLAQPARSNSTGAEGVRYMSYYGVQVGAPNSAFVPPRPRPSVSPSNNSGRTDHQGGRAGRGGGRSRSFGGRGGRGRGRGGRGQGRGGPQHQLRKSDPPQQGDWLCESCGDVA